jgi:hypothetical protein
MPYNLYPILYTLYHILYCVYPKSFTLTKWDCSYLFFIQTYFYLFILASCSIDHICSVDHDAVLVGVPRREGFPSCVLNLWLFREVLWQRHRQWSICGPPGKSNDTLFLNSLIKTLFIYDVIKLFKQLNNLKNINKLSLATTLPVIEACAERHHDTNCCSVFLCLSQRPKSLGKEIADLGKEKQSNSLCYGVVRHMHQSLAEFKLLTSH